MCVDGQIAVVLNSLKLRRRDVGVADWRRPGERVGRVFSLPNLEMLAVTHGARSDAGDDGRARGLELLTGDGFVYAEEAGPVRGIPADEIRAVGCGEATTELRRRQGSPLKDAAGPFENPVRLIGANAQLSSQNSGSKISETHTSPSSVFSLGMLRASTAVSSRSFGHASSASVMFLSLQAAASLAANCSRNFSAMNLL